ncbi:MAG: hypothetical protein K2Y23_21110 [Cyanobacteria bacterium]|nr:hypothetical protein [Cyanobacteriota bacterium]
MLQFAARWFDPATVSRVFDPLIADWQREWLDATPSRRAGAGARGLIAFLCAVIVSSPSIFHTHAPGAVTNRVVVRMTRFIAVASLIILSPPLMQLANDDRYLVLVVTMLPSAITTAFPFSMISAADAVRRSQPLAPHIERALVSKLAILAMLFMMTFGGFVVPAANQAFRVVQTRGGAPLLRSVRELTTWQLLTDPTMTAPQEPYTGGADRAVRIQRELNNRAAFALIPVVLLWLRWRTVATDARRWWSPLPAVVASIIVIAVFASTSYWGYLLEQQWQLAAGTGHWFPVAVFAVSAVTTRIRQRRRHAPQAL